MSDQTSNINKIDDENNILEQNWLKICGITISISLLIILLVDTSLNINLSFYQPIAIIFGIGALLSLFIAGKTTVYNHRFSKHPASFIGQTEFEKKKNTKALILFSFFVVFSFFLMIMLGYIISNQYTNLKFTKIIALCFYAASLCLVWMGSVQFNVKRIAHLLGVLGLFATLLAGNICLFILLSKLREFGVVFSSFYLILTFLEISSSLIYMVAYLLDKFKKAPKWLQPGFFQTIWIIFFVTGVAVYASLFSDMNFQARVSLFF